MEKLGKAILTSPHKCRLSQHTMPDHIKGKGEIPPICAAIGTELCHSGKKKKLSNAFTDVLI